MQPGADCLEERDFSTRYLFCRRLGQLFAHLSVLGSLHLTISQSNFWGPSGYRILARLFTCWSPSLSPVGGRSPALLRVALMLIMSKHDPLAGFSHLWRIERLISNLRFP
ncbi:hypothetical protein L596_011488 [Steinernema carpocapsae]|uniref:Uncharacterized protein n=1 Tax=Steinernema carpocapsae TaxID=34508 RepID=A0A4U5NUH0_STECR|nr:hypothetical protein L596_011488 [Steinernema carpocapsae]